MAHTMYRHTLSLSFFNIIFLSCVFSLLCIGTSSLFLRHHGIIFFLSWGSHGSTLLLGYHHRYVSKEQKIVFYILHFILFVDFPHRLSFPLCTTLFLARFYCSAYLSWCVAQWNTLYLTPFISTQSGEVSAPSSPVKVTSFAGDERAYDMAADGNMLQGQVCGCP